MGSTGIDAAPSGEDVASGVPVNSSGRACLPVGGRIYGALLFSWWFCEWWLFRVRQLSAIATEFLVTNPNSIASQSARPSADARGPRTLTRKSHSDCVTRRDGWEILSMLIVVMFLLGFQPLQCSGCIGC